MSMTIDIRPVFYVVGALVSILAVAMIVPIAVDLAVGNPDWIAFAIASAVTLLFGVQLMLTTWTSWEALNLRQTFLMTALAWIMVCAFASLPFMMARINLSPADAYFEAMSALTTTGSTVISGLDRLPPGLLLWRSLLQWLGGIGIIGMGIAILPFLRVGGMQLFQSESSDRSDKVAPRASDLVAAVAWVYLTLTVACTGALAYAGMSLFDAVNHAMTTVSTGGFSTRDASISGWENPMVEWVLVIFMMLGGMPFVRFISLVRRTARPFWADTQVLWYVGFLVAVSVCLASWLSWTREVPWLDAIRLTAFNVVSVVTTTGFASTDYALWGPMAEIAFFMLTFVGGCTGSTAGGLKIFRFEILFIVLHMLQRRLYSPNLVIPLSYNGRPFSTDIMVSVMSFGFVYMATVFILALLLGFMGSDMVTAISGSATAVSNVGPGLGPVIGPSGNFASLPDGSKWLLAFGMLLGRLEFFTVLVILSPSFWKR
jgi:trk system potassium uptake protein TrkH